jgi:hypothetical protein
MASQAYNTGLRFRAPGRAQDKNAPFPGIGGTLHHVTHHGITRPPSLTACQPCLCVSQFLDVERCVGGIVCYLLRKFKYMLSTYCVDNSVDELFLTAPSRLFT